MGGGRAGGGSERVLCPEAFTCFGCRPKIATDLADVCFTGGGPAGCGRGTYEGVMFRDGKAAPLSPSDFRTDVICEMSRFCKVCRRYSLETRLRSGSSTPSTEE